MEFKKNINFSPLQIRTKFCRPLGQHWYSAPVLCTHRARECNMWQYKPVSQNAGASWCENSLTAYALPNHQEVLSYNEIMG